MQFLKVDERTGLLAETAFHDINYLRNAHLQQVAKILEDPEASRTIASVPETTAMPTSPPKAYLPMCQDTGTAIIKRRARPARGDPGVDEKALSRGVHNTTASTTCAIRKTHL